MYEMVLSHSVTQSGLLAGQRSDLFSDPPGFLCNECRVLERPGREAGHTSPSCPDVMIPPKHLHGA
jgi:hypothetical protein